MCRLARADQAHAAELDRQERRGGGRFPAASDAERTPNPVPSRRRGLPGHAGIRSTIYTTRPDTLFGATYMVLAPEHPLVDRSRRPSSRAAVRTYVEQAEDRKSDLDRMAETKDEDRRVHRRVCDQPGHGETIPIWVADYVLMGYGTGAIMAVPRTTPRLRVRADSSACRSWQVVQPPARRPIMDDGLRRLAGPSSWSRSSPATCSTALPTARRLKTD